MTRLCFLILLAALSPAFAQETAGPNLASEGRGTQGAVARMVLAHQLFALGQTNKDPLSVLAAARLAAQVGLVETARAHETVGDAALATTPGPTTPAQMFDTAADLAADNEPLLDLIDAARREAPFAPVSTVVSSKSTLAAAQTETWPVPFFGASLAEIAILGDGGSNLDLKVTDEGGALICQDVGPADSAYCSFYPGQNGTFLITVSNSGHSADSYLLLSN